MSVRRYQTWKDIMGQITWKTCIFRRTVFLDESLDDVEYAIFDDINGGLKFFPNYKSWLGCQEQFYATDKYKGKN